MSLYLTKDNFGLFGLGVLFGVLCLALVLSFCYFLIKDEVRREVERKAPRRLLKAYNYKPTLPPLSKGDMDFLSEVTSPLE